MKMKSNVAATKGGNRWVWVLFALLSGLNIPILHLSRVGDSLEQVFLNVISQ